MKILKKKLMKTQKVLEVKKNFMLPKKFIKNMHTAHSGIVINFTLPDTNSNFYHVSFIFKHK